MNPICMTAKCCGCMLIAQLIPLLVTLGSLVAFVLLFKFYVIPWGEDQLKDALKLPAGTDLSQLSASVIAANNCSGCAFGTNTEWPTKTTGALHFLDTSAGSTASGAIGLSLAATAVAGAGSMLWASFFPSAAAAMSLSGGFYEITHVFEQAQFIGIIGQLQLRGAPTFLFQFSKELAWTNFNVPKSLKDKVSTRRQLADLIKPNTNGETGPIRYAQMIGVKPEDLFFYTLMTFALVILVLHGLYFIWVAIISAISKKEKVGEVARKWYRKVIWAGVLVLLLAQYIFTMAGSFYLYEHVRTGKPTDSKFYGVALALGLLVCCAILLGVIVISRNKDELRDVGTFEHDQRPFSMKYSAYYDEYNFDNRFFFVPRILLAVSTGAVVGVVQDPTKQIVCILAITTAYLLLLILREPNLLRFLYYIGITSVFMKIVLLCMMLVLVHDDMFPQSVRDKVAYAIIGVNMFVFFLLFLRQIYVVGYKIVQGCKNKNNTSSDIEASNGSGTNGGNQNRNVSYARLESSNDGPGPVTAKPNANNPRPTAPQATTISMDARGQPRPGVAAGAAASAGVVTGAAMAERNTQRPPQQNPMRQSANVPPPVPVDRRSQQARTSQSVNTPQPVNTGRRPEVTAPAQTAMRTPVGPPPERSPTRTSAAAGTAVVAASRSPSRSPARSPVRPPTTAPPGNVAQPGGSRSPSRSPVRTPMRKSSVDIDEMEDVVPENPQFLRQAQQITAGAAHSAAATPAPAPAVPKRESFLAFTDLSTTSDDANVPDEAVPFSVQMNRQVSTDSYNSDEWLSQRSDSTISDSVAGSEDSHPTRTGGRQQQDSRDLSNLGAGRYSSVSDAGSINPYDTNTLDDIALAYLKPGAQPGQQEHAESKKTPATETSIPLLKASSTESDATSVDQYTHRESNDSYLTAGANDSFISISSNITTDDPPQLSKPSKNKYEDGATF
ncbi:TPA: hypothetical protein N0F65_003887 [Lagenidium giganteum]|uniref:TRP C-terminal domain-containing protein n=1 Tax=Lagenidium giganteum TaxID=4803 RepID=A0AAV2ZC94_9STRA|nr:TPA: hypothetical protein N0F65_003887 [Lagenidium giganteum]